MTDQRELDRLLGAFFVEGTNELPDRVLDATLEEVDRTPQRRVTRMPWRFPAMNTYARFVAAAALGVLVIGGALYLGGLRQTGDDQSPTPTASATTSANPSQSAQPHAAVYVFTQGAGTAAECGNSTQGGCISRLWVANLDGTGARELIPNQSGCQRFQAWSPDGTRLLFSRSECRWEDHSPDGFVGMTGPERFYLTDASGGAPQVVDTGCVSPCLYEDDAVFSADGLRILFVRTKSVPVSPSASPDPVTGKPAEGTEVTVLASIDLATGRVSELGAFGESGRCGSEWPRSSCPSWSPDRTQIVFTVAAQIVGPEPPKDPAVFVADADGRNVHQVSAFGQGPAWSPDGARILFQGIQYSWTGTWFPGKVVRSSSDIYTVRADGTDLRQLTTDGVSYGPAWSAAGRIWFIRPTVVDGIVQDDGTVQYWVMDAEGSHATQLSGRPPEQAWLLQPTP